jgi:hypothetical protein
MSWSKWACTKWASGLIKSNLRIWVFNLTTYNVRRPSSKFSCKIANLGLQVCIKWWPQKVEPFYEENWFSTSFFLRQYSNDHIHINFRKWTTPPFLYQVGQRGKWQLFIATKWIARINFSVIHWTWEKSLSAPASYPNFEQKKKKGKKSRNNFFIFILLKQTQHMPVSIAFWKQKLQQQERVI